MMDYGRKIKRNVKWLFGDAAAIMVDTQLAGHIPTLIDGAILLITEAAGVLLIVDSIWLHFAKRTEQAKGHM